MGKSYSSVFHVRWELPFPLFLPRSIPFFCWDPEEDIAIFVPEGEVGSFNWQRYCDFFSAEEAFMDKPADSYKYDHPSAFYRITSKLKSREKRIVTAHIMPGPTGGFSEARPYTVANIFMLSVDTENKHIINRAIKILNNVINVYRLFSMDPLLRLIKGLEDQYYTSILKASLPYDAMNLSPKEILEHFREYDYSASSDHGEAIIGANSSEDILGHRLVPEIYNEFLNIVLHHPPTELFHELFLSAIRRLKRKEYALAIIDAQSAFESAVSSMLRDVLLKRHNSFESLSIPQLLTKRLLMLDNLSNSDRSFEKSVARKNWNTDLYKIRNEIIHEGSPHVSFDQSKKGIVAGLKAVKYLHKMSPLLARRVIWSDNALDLPHIRETAGRLSRIFEY